MPELWIKHPVSVKARVTPELKKRMASEVQESMKRLDIEVGQLDFQAKRAQFEAEKQNAPPVLQKQLEVEKQKRLEKRSELVGRLRDIARLEDGTEINQGTVEALSQAEPGTDWDRLYSTEIVLEDGRVVEIRSGK
ncbi:MAG: YlqD family protein [Bacillota bacterium]|nr:YlqD family protein [Bacillota bacterium]